MRCSSPASGSLRCAGLPTTTHHASSRAPASTSRPAREVNPSASGVISWFNQTFYTNDQFYGGTGPTAFYGAVAYDPALQEMVYFGGCSYQCPSNQTWVYDQYGWANVTLEIAGYVPAAYGMSMAWDPQFNAVIMVGGVSAGDVVDNSTWGFYGTEWFNWTQFVGAPAALVGYNGTAFASMAWDGALQSMILVDGCALANCTIVWTGTWELTDDGGWGVIGAGPFDFLWGASMAYDPISREMVYFGGLDVSNSSVTNGTYILNSTGWWNITTSSRECIDILGCIYLYPSARGFGSMTWDGQINAIVMVGGDGPGGYLNDTWYFYNGTWEASDFFESIPGPLAGWGGAMDPNSSVVAPALVGGICYQFCENDTWVLEIPPSPSFVGITPSPADTQFVVNVSVSNLKGDGSGPVETVLLFDSGPNYVISDETDVNFTTAAYTAYANFSYTEPGTYTVYAEIGDFFDVYSFVTTTLVVDQLTELAPSAVENPTEVGAAVAFTAGATLGTGGYTYAWNFGDGSPISAAADPTHTYAAAGTYTVTLNVTDSIGSWNQTTFTVTVDPRLTATAAPNKAATDLGDAVTFTATPAGGSGSYASYAWTYGDSDTGTGASASHTYAGTGTYTVDVTVTDSLGFTVEATTSVTINPDLTGAISASTLSPTTTTSVSFTATPTGGTPTYTYAWTFGDGGTSTSATPSHTYSSAGTFTATVVITDAVGGTVTKTLSISVSKAPTVLGLPPTEGYGLIAAIIILLVILALAAVMMRRRRKPTSSSPTAWNQGASTAPGSSAPAPPPATGGSPPTPPPGAS
ncbi:MAG: PKD domain-containing protein [Thermoplasmata archaeon]